ncbi:ElyC/SanA/YdcF family protein [Vibrio marisflavi]|uniref:DUF218 domain-containing protein n=1 Tax=Vibrio marisflavi CECT 7928 TaxID=634439 RepID=A0ABN8E7N2_9VIBR|nr:ElyC/SanA/YdcF family protein [Vibrio marisflavi]CAH0540733.1 hypothetical protein VMF7928_03075 [Vibrio marisflavi CECT 7928]
MGFILKKVISAFLMPFSIGLLLLFLGLWFLYRQSYKKAKVFLTVSFIWLFLIGYAPISNSLIEPLETAYPPLTLNSYAHIDAKYILLLGGDFNGRAYEAIRLFHHLHGTKIITSGYAAPGLDIPEAILNANKLVSIGIPKKDILIQSKPRDTREEAQNIKRLIGNEPFILVTSAYHMPRAMSIFLKEGLHPIPAPTEVPMSGNSPQLLSVPNGDAISNTRKAFHEYLGLCWNMLKNWTSSVI